MIAPISPAPTPVSDFRITIVVQCPHFMPIILYDAESKGAINYLALAKELIKKNEK